jgi:hypothetical protein
MAFFKQIHKERKAKNIGLSIKESILTLRKQVEERSEAPLVHPFTGMALNKDESAYIQQIQKQKGFQTVREAFAYFGGRLEGRIEKRLGTKALKQTLDEASQEASKVAEIPPPIEPVKVGGQQCHYYRFNSKRQLVECMRKYEKENVIDSFTQQICDYCWSLDPYKKYPIPKALVGSSYPQEPRAP